MCREDDHQQARPTPLTPTALDTARACCPRALAWARHGGGVQRSKRPLGWFSRGLLVYLFLNQYCVSPDFGQNLLDGVGLSVQILKSGLQKRPLVSGAADASVHLKNGGWEMSLCNWHLHEPSERPAVTALSSVFNCWRRVPRVIGRGRRCRCVLYTLHPEP